MKTLEEKDRDNIWHPYTSLEDADPPLIVESAQGIYLNTTDGRKIIDAISSWWVNLHGHSHPEISKAIAAQAAKLEHVIFAGFTHEPAITLSENLLSILPDNQSKIFFSDDGSTAVEVAIKMAIQYWSNMGVNRSDIIALNGAYHGDTFGAMAAGERGIFNKPFSNKLFPVKFIDFPDKTNSQNALTKFRETIALGNVAAFIYEPLVQGASGMRMYSPQVLDEMIQHAQSQNVVCIADEVFTGFGRTGKMFASDYLRSKPDIIALSKGLTGGALPLGVTACCEKIVNAFRHHDVDKTFYHGHSYTANPIACAAANASFELLTNNECQKQIELISKLHLEFAKAIQNNPAIKEVRTLGSILAIEIATSENSSYTNSIRKHIYHFFLKRNILLRPLGNIFYILPPYVITKEELQKVYTAIAEFLDDLK